MADSLALPVIGNVAEAGDAHDHAPDAAGQLFDTAADASAAAGEKRFGKTYWRSVEERLATPEFLESVRPEFPEGADLPPTGVVRRDFLQLLGASLALAGVGCTTKPSNEKMIPYTTTPSGLSPGNPLHYASGMTLGGHTTGLLVTAYEGRPTKIEGNPEHPWSLGAAGPTQQAWLLGLYDPQRARVLRQGKSPRALRTLAEDVQRLVNEVKDGGARVRFLVEPSASPLMGAIRQRIQQKLPNAKFVSYASVAQDEELGATRALFGQALQPLYDFAKADVVVSLDADFLEAAPQNLKYARDFADRRDPALNPNGSLNRLYVAEARLSITGGMADHRARVKSGQILAVAAALAEAVGGPAAGLAAAAQGKAALPPELQKWVQTAAADLKSRRGRSLVVAGERQPAAVHALAHAINAALDNTAAGATVRFVPSAAAEPAGFAGLKALADELKAGAVDVLVVTAWNPVYTAPADTGLAEALDARTNARREKLSVVYTALHEDETSALADWFVPAAHELEGWGDGRSQDGTVTLVQPLLQPLFNGVPTAELLALYTGAQHQGGLQLLKEHWRTAGAGLTGGQEFDVAWETWVSQGFIPGSAPAPVTVTANFGGATQLVQAAPAPKLDGLELNFVRDYMLWDGRFANNAWLAEAPNPITKLTWDNAALVSPETAKRLNLRFDQMKNESSLATLTVGERTLQLPVWVVPGHADDTVTVALGWGRQGLHETVAKGKGFDAKAVRTSASPWFEGGAALAPTREMYPMGATQLHWSMEGRPLALDMTLEEFNKDPVVMKRVKGELPSLLKDYAYEDYKWGMAIDLARCTGCSACVVACQAENNIPVVGKEQVRKGREMLWLRIDRYFSGDEAAPEMVMQPVMCVHCEKAPCEYVCPVNATVHSDEGLNLMVYNRCVGTRYCSNNCPYKVRRFNYLHFSQGKSAPEKMLMNPDVTVRNRGVMEKCTYCVQRIERTRIDARVERRAIKDGELKTACQQTCPTNAIVFGTLSDKEAVVTKRHEDARAYKLLHELGTAPRTAHMVRIRNPHPDLVEKKSAHEGGH